MNNNLIGILGASFVGKSHIVHILTKKANVPYVAYVTIGCQISRYNYKNINYSLCDIFPQYSYLQTAKNWLSKFKVFIFICDASNKSSINTIYDFYNEIKPEKYAIFINKTDLVSKIDIDNILILLKKKFKNFISIKPISVNNKKNLRHEFNLVLDKL